MLVAILSSVREYRGEGQPNAITTLR